MGLEYVVRSGTGCQEVVHVIGTLLMSVVDFGLNIVKMVSYERGKLSGWKQMETLESTFKQSNVVGCHTANFFELASQDISRAKLHNS